MRQFHLQAAKIYGRIWRRQYFIYIDQGIISFDMFVLQHPQSSRCFKWNPELSWKHD